MKSGILNHIFQPQKITHLKRRNPKPLLELRPFCFAQSFERAQPLASVRTSAFCPSSSKSNVTRGGAHICLPLRRLKTLPTFFPFSLVKCEVGKKETVPLPDLFFYILLYIPDVILASELKGSRQSATEIMFSCDGRWKHLQLRFQMKLQVT